MNRPHAGAAVDPLSLATPSVRALQPYHPGKPLEELARQYGICNAVKLASNESPLGPSVRAVAAAESVLGQMTCYPDGNGFALKSALAQKLGIVAEQITLGNGSNDVLEITARAFVTSQDEVIFSEHAFAIYPIITQAVGGKAIVTPARDYGHDLAAMRQAVSERTRLIFIANPNNPTGTWLRAGELETFVRSLPAHVISVVDEAYFEYVHEPEFPDSTQWLAHCPNLIVTRTFSKIYGLAGLRVGYALSSGEIADILNRVRQPFNVNSVALAAATAALGDQAHVAQADLINREGLQQLIGGFSELGLRYIPSIGNFICVEVGDAATVYEGLLREGVIVRPVANYGLLRHLRVTVGLPQENERFLQALKKLLGF